MLPPPSYAKNSSAYTKNYKPRQSAYSNGTRRRTYGPYIPGRRKSTPKVDTKYVDTDFSDTTADIDGAYTKDICTTLQGNTLSSRTGNEVLSKALSFKGIIRPISSTYSSAETNMARLVIGIGHTGAANFNSTLIYNINAAGNYCTGHRNMLYTKEYTILRDDLLCPTIAGYNSTSSGQIYDNIVKEYYIKDTVGIPVSYSANTGGSSDLNQNYFFAVLFPATDESWIIESDIRWTFTG